MAIDLTVSGGPKRHKAPTASLTLWVLTSVDSLWRSRLGGPYRRHARGTDSPRGSSIPGSCEAEVPSHPAVPNDTRLRQRQSLWRSRLGGPYRSHSLTEPILPVGHRFRTVVRRRSLPTTTTLGGWAGERTEHNNHVTKSALSHTRLGQHTHVPH